VTSEYLDSLQAALSFDRSLARRVRKEFEDHLREAVAADRSEDRCEAERNAVASCGDPRAIAGELAATSLAKQTKRLAVVIVLVLLGVLLSMKGHIAWYVAMQWAINDEMRPLATAIGTLDRYAFWIATFVGAAAWAFGTRYRRPSDYFYVKYTRYFRRFCLVACTTAAALSVSVLSDAALATIRLASTNPSIAFVIPILSIALELVGAGTLIVLIRSLARRAASTAELQKI
jgi:hypothetical protein